jgi:hypothetical protein
MSLSVTLWYSKHVFICLFMLSSFVLGALMFIYLKICFIYEDKKICTNTLRTLYVQHNTLWRLFLWCMDVFLIKLLGQLSSASKETDIFERPELISHGRRDVFLYSHVHTSSGDYSTTCQILCFLSTGTKSSDDATHQPPLSNAEVSVHNSTSTPQFAFVTLQYQV